MIMKL